MNNGNDTKDLEVVEDEIEAGPEAGGLVSAGVNAGVADQLYLAENINKMIDAQNRIRIAILGLAQPGDWVIFGGKDTQKAEIGFAGSARIASTLGISFTNWTGIKQTGTDEKGEWYRWEFECDASMGKRMVRVYGRAGSRDKFFGKKDGEFKPLHDVDEGNVKMAARRAAMKEGTKVICGLHHMDPEFLISKGVKLTSAGGYEFKPKADGANGAAPANGSKISDPQRKRLWAICKNAGKTEAQIKEYLKGFNIESTTDIEKKDYEKICAWGESKEAEYVPE